MWRSKKLILIGILMAVVLAGTLGGVAIAQANDENTNTVQDIKTNLMEKVAEIYQANTGVAIDAAELQKAFEQAQQEIKDEAYNQFLQKLVDEGKITQEQLNEFKAWLESRPNLPIDEFRQWMESHPDIPYFFGSDNSSGMTPFGGMHRNNGKTGEGFGFMFRNRLPD
jgi:hypothetical protein